jgi:hypothetical protein
MLRQEFVDRGTELVRDWHNRQWDLGYLINEERLLSEDMNKLAQIWRVKTSTLKDWESVAREFPKPKQIKGLEWSHHRELSRIPTQTDRMKLVKQRPVSEWTVDGLRAAVNKWLLEHAPADTKRSSKLGKPAQMQARQGMGFPDGSRLAGELVEPGKITLEFPHPAEVSSVVFGGRTIIQITMVDE